MVRSAATPRVSNHEATGLKGMGRSSRTAHSTQWMLHQTLLDDFDAENPTHTADHTANDAADDDGA
jgi:hypothetical protein